MFGLDFSKLAVIFVVVLIVVGPKRMPGLVKTAGRWVGKARAMARDFQQQLEHEVNLEELHKITDLRASEAQATTPAAPDSAGETPVPTYPYSVPESPATESSATETLSAETGAAEPTTAPTADDTYSHAHAAGDAPMPDVAAHAAMDAAPVEPPVQAALDLSVPDQGRLAATQHST